MHVLCFPMEGLGKKKTYVVYHPPHKPHRRGPHIGQPGWLDLLSALYDDLPGSPSPIPIQGLGHPFSSPQVLRRDISQGFFWAFVTGNASFKLLSFFRPGVCRWPNWIGASLSGQGCHYFSITTHVEIDSHAGIEKSKFHTPLARCNRHFLHTT